MPHYVCTGGCGAVSDTPGTCQANGCPLYQHPFVECNCTDGNHEEVLKAAGKEEKKEE